MKTDVKAALELSLKVITIAVALFGIWKYFGDRALDRDLEARSKALAMIELYSGGEIRDSRQTLFNFWLDNLSDAIPDIEKSVRPGNYRLMWKTALEFAPNSDELMRSFYMLSGFFDQLQFCYESAVCDRVLIRRYFCSIAVRLENLYAPVFDILRSRSGFDEFGIGLTGLVHRCVSF